MKPTRPTLLTRALMALLAFGLAAPAFAADPTAEELLKKYDEIMGPANFESTTRMTAHRDDDTERNYKMRMVKSGSDKFRIWFEEPSSVRGQEILRVGDNNWVYMPSLKRAVRLASRDSFQGGDFNNADVLRVNYTADYTAKLGADPATPTAWVVELQAKTPDAAYDHVKLWMSKADSMPVKGEFYTASGKMLRAAEFSEVKDFGGYKRPAKVVMKNMLATKRFSVLTFDTLDTKVNPPATKFVLDDLGH